MIRALTLALTSAVIFIGAVSSSQAAYISSHTGTSRIGCTSNLPSQISNDDVALTCNDTNVNSSSIDNTLDVNSVNGSYHRNVALRPTTVINFTDTVNNNTGSDWTELRYDWETQGNLKGYVPNSFSISFQNSESVFSSNSSVKFLEILFAAPVVSGSGFTISFAIDYSGSSSNRCFNCSMHLTLSDAFDPPPQDGVPSPGAFTLLGLGLVGLGWRKRLS